MLLTDFRAVFAATPKQYSPGMSDAPTKRQALVLAYIAAFTAERGYAPTLREIGDGLGIVNVNAVSQHVGYLRQKGRLVWEDGKQRTMRVVEVVS